MPKERTDFFLDAADTSADRPLAVRMRPRSLDEVVGQSHLLAAGKILRRAIQADRLTSLILFGPPGAGKTSLAFCIARQTNALFVSLNATTAGVDDLRRVISQAKKRRVAGAGRTICFVDEIHRFNKAQQDVLLPDVEDATIVLIGATVHNPFFSIASALVSRSLICELHALAPEEVTVILRRALTDKERGLGGMPVTAEKEALAFLARVSDGDARRALQGLEIAALTTPPDPDGRVVLTLEAAAESVQKKPLLYDRDEDAHYDTASAFIKSMRGSDPDAAVYWLAKMLSAGEDPRFIARRICILAAEDIGNADPLALVVANAARQVTEFVGMPEARIPLAQAVIYVACAPKSNACYKAIEKATRAVEEERLQEVPQHLKDASCAQAASLGRGAGYKYAHDYEGHFVKQAYTEQPVRLYEPTEMGFEAKIRKRLEKTRG